MRKAAMALLVAGWMACALAPVRAEQAPQPTGDDIGAPRAASEPEFLPTPDPWLDGRNSGLGRDSLGLHETGLSNQGLVPDEPCLDGNAENFVPSFWDWLDPPGRHRGLGDPLEGESWLNRPLNFGGFIGLMEGDELISGEVDQGSGFVWGFRLGWDFDYYWALETRLANANVDVELSNGQFIDLNDVLLWDANLMYYPWGDSRWRPFVSLGFGLDRFEFRDQVNQDRRNEVVFGLPIGLGLKYRLNGRLAMRLDATNNISFAGGGLEPMNNFSLTGGLELRFGGKRRSYGFWQPTCDDW